MSRLKYIFTIITLQSLFSAGICSAADISFKGTSKKVIDIEPEKDTGLDEIYVLYNMEGVSISYNSSSSSIPKWYRYSNLGGGYAEEISDIDYSDGVSTLHNPSGDMGYIIEDNDSRTYFWIVDYSQHQLRLNSVTPSSTQECETTILDVDADASAIHYYTINGRQMTLDRELKVTYDNLEWNEDSRQYIQQEIVKNLSDINSTITLMPAVFCTTTFTISGDRFLKEWGSEIKIESTTFTPNAVECHTIAESDNDDSEKDNLIKVDSDGALGGSARATIRFYSYVTDAVIHNEWQMADDEDFENITYRFNEQDLEYTFTEEGVTYVRYIGSNSDGSCETYGDTYTISIGASDLKIPNAFSPGDDGINDIWKVAYRSLLDFECWIFDRNGNQMYHYDKPEGGWDGKYKGKYVKPGVYYYVIQATGADGKKYKKSGDINIIRYKGNGSGNGGNTTPVE